MPHHVTHRGNRRQQTFFGEEDYQHYLELISRFCRAEQVAIWAYCLMPNCGTTAHRLLFFRQRIACILSS